jgi:mannose-1-phosphate guanylyltransferase
MRYAMIMAGGSGTRLWPMSRKSRPKQLLPLIDGKSLLEIAAMRLEKLVPLKHRLICTAETYRGEVRRVLSDFSDEQILGEPMGRDTVNAVGLTAAVLLKRDPESVFAVLTADHLIEPQHEFARAFELGFKTVENDPSRFVTFSIKPAFAATGYGYVERGEPLAGFAGAFKAGRFAEKPDLATAESFVNSGRFNWNSGMFIFQARMFMDSLKRYMPENYAGLTRIGESWNDGAKRQAALNEIYPTLKKISVDFGVMEPASRDPNFTIVTIPMDVKWMDVGSWISYGETLPSHDASNNRTNSKAAHLDSRNVLAISDDPSHTIATVDCEDLIIVHTTDATLVCKRESAERIKDVAQRIDESLQ